MAVNPLNAELNSICHLLALLGVHHFLHVSRIRVKHSLQQRVLNKSRASKDVHNKDQPLKYGGPGNSVGIATGYGLDGPGIESRGR